MMTTEQTHQVFICDKEGIDLLYPSLLEALKSNKDKDQHFTVLYYSDNGIFLFLEELELLSKRFPAKLICHYRAQPEREDLELILNTNTKPTFDFELFLDEENTDTIVSELQYLGIKSEDIHSHFLLTI
jgi:hypothetical protein